MKDSDSLREALAKIAEIASEAAGADRDSTEATHDDEEVSGGVRADTTAVCTPRFLPKRLLVKAAEVARKINPVNALSFGPLATVGVAPPDDPLQIAVMVRNTGDRRPAGLP